MKNSKGSLLNPENENQNDNKNQNEIKNTSFFIFQLLTPCKNAFYFI